MFALLLACVQETEGSFDLSVTREESDCVTPPKAFFGRVYLDQADGKQRVLPFADDCWLSGNEFRCDLDAFDQFADFNTANIDAAVRLDLQFEGRFGEDGLGGTASWVTSCEGPECALVATVSPEFCSTTYTWTGEPR